MEGKIVLAALLFFLNLAASAAPPAHQNAQTHSHPSSEACVSYPLGTDTTPTVLDPDATGAKLSPDLSGSLQKSKTSSPTTLLFRNADGSERWKKEVAGRVSEQIYSPDGTRIALTLSDKSVKILDAYSGAVVMDIAGFKSTPVVDFVSGNRLSTYDAEAHTTQLWDIAKQASVYSYDKIPHDGRKPPTYSASGGAILSHDSTKFTVSTHGKTWSAKNSRHEPVKLSLDGSLVVAKSDSDTLDLYDATTGQKLHQWKVPSIQGFSISPDGSRIAVHTGKEGLLLYDTRSKTLLRRLNAEIHDQEFSADSRHLIAYPYHQNGKVFVYSAETTCIPSPGPVSIASSTRQGVAPRLSDFCSEDFSESAWSAINRPHGNAWNPESAENYLYRFQKPGGFVPAAHASILDSLLASDAPAIRPDLVAGALRNALAASPSLYDYYVNKYPALMNRWYSPSPCHTENDDAVLIPAAKSYFEELYARQKPQRELKDFASLRPLSPALARLSPEEKDSFTGMIARNLAAGTDNHAAIRGVFASQVNYLAREHIQGFFGLPPRPLSNLALARDSREIAPVILGTHPFSYGNKPATQTPFGFYALRLPGIDTSKLSATNGTAQNIAWQHSGRSYQANFRLTPVKQTSELVTAKESLPWEDHWSDRRLSTLVTLGAAEGSQRETTMNHYIHSVMTRDVPEENKFQLTRSEPVANMAEKLQELIESGAVDIISRESSAHGNYTDFTLLDASGRIRTASRFLGNFNGHPYYEDVYFLLPPSKKVADGKVRVGSDELGKWMNKRQANGGGALSVIDWSCGACSRAPYLLEGAATDKLVVLPTESTAYEFRSTPTFPLNRLFQQLVTSPNYEQMEKIMHPTKVEDVNHLLTPNMREYQTRVTSRIHPVKTSLEIFEDRVPYQFDDRVRELHPH